MRKKLLYVILIPLVILLVVVYLFHNSWIESGIEYAMEEVTGAKVEIDDLHLDFSPLGIEWSRLQVANPNDTWRNVFETGKVKFSIELGQLLRGKYIIDLVEVEDLTIDTKRQTDGAISQERNKRAILAGDKLTFSKLAEDALKNTLTTTPLFDIAKLKKGFNADSLIKALDMKTVKHIDTLKTKIENITAQWSLLKNDFENQKQKVLDIEGQIKNINPSELNNVQNITSAIATIDKANSSINEITQLVNTKSQMVQSSIQNLSSSIGMINTYVKSDFDKLKSMARLPSINKNGMAQLLVGTEMNKRAKAYLYWIDAARTNVQKYQGQPEYEAPQRMKGQDIKFPVERGYPKFWIKKIAFSGGTDKSASDYFKAIGNAANISDNQNLSGVPLTVSLEGIGNGNRSLKLAGLFDRRNNVTLDEISASLSNVPVNDFSLGKSDFLPSKVSSAIMNTSLKISVPGNKFDATANFDLKNIKLQFEADARNVVEKLAREVLTGINEFTVSLRLWNTSGNFDIALSTDIDDKLMQKVSEVMGKEIENLQNELQTKFNAIIQDEIQKFEKKYKSKLDEIQNQYGNYLALFSSDQNLVNNKKQELTSQLEKQKRGFVEDKLKGLFKK
jgi:uncharacterized protein (TIGR03545 family)